MILLSTIVTFVGSTGVQSVPMPTVPGPDACVTVEILAVFELGAESWGENLLTSGYSSTAHTTVGWSLTSGTARLASSRFAGEVSIAGTFAPQWDGATDFAGASGQNVSVPVAAWGQGCAPVEQCGPLLRWHARDYMEQNTSQWWTFQPGQVASVHLTTRTQWQCVARVTVE